MIMFVSGFGERALLQVIGTGCKGITRLCLKGFDYLIIFCDVCIVLVLYDMIESSTRVKALLIYQVD